MKDNLPNHFEIKWEINRKTQSQTTVGNNSALQRIHWSYRNIGNIFKCFEINLNVSIKTLRWQFTGILVFLGDCIRKEERFQKKEYLNFNPKKLKYIKFKP